MRSATFIAAVLTGALLGAVAMAPPGECGSEELRRVDLAVTAYNEDRAVVYDVRSIGLEKGINSVRFADVAALIDPTSVQLTSKDAPFTMREQNFDYDVAGDAQLLYKYLGRRVRLELEGGGSATGTLIVGPRREKRRRNRRSARQDITYHLGNVALADEQGGIHIFPLRTIKSFALVPTGGPVLTRPTLNWLIESGEAGTRNCEIAYMTAGMSWRADYTLKLPADPASRISADLVGVVTVNNNTGTTYPEARLKLVAGDVHMVEEERRRDRRAGVFDSARKEASSGPPQFKEREMFEYHLYDLQRRTTLANNETKQIEFLRAGGIPVDRFFVYDGAVIRTGPSQDQGYGTACDRRVWTYVEFKNSEENHLGMPLPRGKIRLVEARGDAEEFIGEATIDHTPRDERITLRIGRAFDLVGERTQTHFTRPSARVIREGFEIAVRSARRTTANVRVVEHLYRGTDWDIIAKNHDYEKTDASTIEFRFALEPGEEKKIRYTVRYKL